MRSASIGWRGRSGPRHGPHVGLVAIGLVLAAKAGNIGTNHLFEAMVLDRLMAFALGWLALAQLVVQPDRGRWLVMAAIGGATLIHPSVGLQLALRAGRELDGLVPAGPMRREVSLRTALPGLSSAWRSPSFPGLAINLAVRIGIAGDYARR